MSEPIKYNDVHGNIRAERTYCVFGVAEREFLLLFEDVREVIELSRIFPIPGAPDYVYGALPLRGRIIPAVDLAKIYPIEKPSYTNPKLVIVDIQNENIGFLSETTPFFVTFDSDIVVDDFIDIRAFFEKYRVKTMTYGKD